MPNCQYCNKMFVNVNQHITKSHSYNVRYSSFDLDGLVKLYRGDQLIGETNFQYGNPDWVECWVLDGDDIYWIQWDTTDTKINQSNFFIIKNNGCPDKEEERLYCKFIQTNYQL